MSIGSTSGRGFEVEYAPYAFGVLVAVSVLVWLWFEYDIRKRRRDERSEKDPSDQDL